MDSFDTLWAELEPIGRYAGTGGYRRYVLSPEELACREWFVSTAQARGLDVETDRNGKLGGAVTDGRGIETYWNFDGRTFRLLKDGFHHQMILNRFFAIAVDIANRRSDLVIGVCLNIFQKEIEKTPLPL